MTVTGKEKKLLLIVMGLLILVACYFLVYTNKQSENEELQAQNDSLNAQIIELQAKIAKESEETSEIERMNAETQNIVYSFPAFLKVEDGINDVISFEENQDVRVTSLTIADPVALVLEGEEDPNAANNTAGNTGTASNAGTNSGNANSNNADANNNNADANNTTGNAAAPATMGLGVGRYTVYGVNTSMVYSCDYASLKELLGLFEEHSKRRSIQELVASFDNSTGELQGSLSFDSYFLFGSEKPYSPMVTDLPLGTSNIFGTIDLPKSESNTNDTKEDKKKKKK